MTAVRYFLGLSLGQANEFTGSCVLEQTKNGNIADEMDAEPPSYAVRHLQRFPFGACHPDIVANVVTLCASPPLAHSTLVVDQTAVGKPVVDRLRKARPCCVIKSVLITSGNKATLDGAGWHVGKKELVGTMQVLLQNRRLHVSTALPDAAILVKELEMFRIKVTTSTNETFESWRERDHDDLVLAVAIAAWFAERGQRRLWVR